VEYPYGYGGYGYPYGGYGYPTVAVAIGGYLSYGGGYGYPYGGNRSYVGYGGNRYYGGSRVLRRQTASS